MKHTHMDRIQDREAVLFELALEKAPGDREAFLDVVCTGNPALRARLEELLAAHEQPDTAWAGLSTAQRQTMKIEIAEAPDESIGQTIGRYKLLQRIGEGGCGAVYMAEQEEPVRRRVALKIIKLGMDTKSVIARFEAECQALALMDHPNIAKVLDAGTTEIGRPFFVMELVKGIKITDYCDRNNLPTRERLELFIQVCHAIQHAHQKGIIHRDIKPSNILVTLHDGVPIPKVIDFGIAKATEQRLTDKTLFTAFEQFIGTPAYTSPEQAEMSGLDIDTRSDIYALGVLFYELLTGTTPFDPKELIAAGLDEMRRTIREKEPARPSTRLSTMLAGELTATAQHRQAEALKLIHLLRGDLDWIVMKCLEKDRTRRYETANGLAMDLKRHLNSEPVLARPPSAAYRFRKLVHRNTLGFAAGAAILTVLILGVVISTRQAVRATRAERKQADLAEHARRAQEREVRQRTNSEQRLYDFLFSAADAKRQGRRSGYRNEVFQYLRQAAALDVPQKDLLALRAMSMSCLGDVAGLTPISLTNFPTDTQIKEFTIDPSGRMGAFTLSDGSIQLLRLPSGEELERLNLNGEQPAWRCVFNEDGQQLASIHRSTNASQTTVSLWARGRDNRWGKLKSIPTPHANNLGMVNSNFFVGLHDQSNQVHKAVDVATQKVIAQIESAEHCIWLAYTETSGFLVMVMQAGGPFGPFTVQIWDVRKDQRVSELRPKLGGFKSLYFSQDDQLLVCIGENGAEIYSVPQFERVAEFPLVPQLLERRSASFARNNALLAISVDRRRIRIYDWVHHHEVATFDDVDMEAGLAFTADDGYLVAVGNRQARLHPLCEQNERTVISNRKPLLNGIGFSPDSRHVSSVCGDGQLVVSDVWTGRSLWETNLTEGQSAGENSWGYVSFSRDGLMAVSWRYDLLPKFDQPERADKMNTLNQTSGGLVFWREQRRLLEVNAPTSAPPFIIDPKFTPDGRFLLATGGEDPGANVSRGHVWRVKRPLSGLTTNHLELENVMVTGANSVIMAVHNQYFAYMSWAANSATEIHLVELEGQQNDRALERRTTGQLGSQWLDFTPDARHLLVVNTNYEIVALDTATGKAVTPPLRAKSLSYAKDPRRLNFCLSPDGSRLAVFGCRDPGLEVEIWDWKTRQYLYSLPAPPSQVFLVRWSPDSQHLAVCSLSETAIWHLALVDGALAELGLFANASPLSSSGEAPNK